MSSTCTQDFLQHHPHRTQQAKDTSEDLNMVQLDVSPPPEGSGDGNPKTGSPTPGSPGSLSPLQLARSVSTTYEGYDSYIEDGLICLKRKLRNMEKRKIKLEDYMKRLKLGQTLNKDQMDAVAKYDEVVHNVAFARQLHKTLEGLKLDLLNAQKKATKEEVAAKTEADRRRLRTVLQVQHLLQSLQHEHVRNDLLAGRGRAPLLHAKQLQSLLELAALLGAKRDNKLRLEEQMERAAVVYLDLLEGRSVPVAGSTFKILKEQLNKLLHCGYFDLIPPPPTKSVKEDVVMPVIQKTGALLRTTCLPSLSKLMKTNDSPNRETPPIQNWKTEFQAMKEQEPPDSWDMEFPDKPVCPEPVILKPPRGSAGFIPKTIKKQAANLKQRTGKKSRRAKDVNAALHTDTPVEVYNSLSALPKDPVLRKQHLEDLMTKIRGSFSFMQDSDLDGESSPANGHTRLGRRPSGSPSPLAQRDLNRSPVEVLPKILHSSPLPHRLRNERKSSLTNGDQSLDNCDLDFTTEDLVPDPLQLSEVFPSPPLYSRESSISISLEENIQPLTPVSESGKQSPCNGVVSRSPTPTPTLTQAQPFSSPLDMASPTRFHNMHSVFKVNAPLPPNGDLDYKSDSGVFAEASRPQHVSASTQTPPEFAPPEDELIQPAYQSEYMVGNTGQILWPPGQSGSSTGRSGQSYYARGSVRGMTRGGKGWARSAGWHRGGFDGYRCGLRSPGGGFIPQGHPRDSGPVLYSSRDTGYKRGGGTGGPKHNSSVGWSDSSQVSSPDRETNYTLVDSAHGDSLSVSAVEVPATPQGGHHHHHAHHAHAPHAMLPLHLYPLPQSLRVAFTSARTVNFAPGTLDQPIVFDLLHSNLGDMFDTQLGRFTCPANGTYVFIFHILKLAVNVPLYVNLMRNEEVMVSAYANDGAPDHETASNHAILPLYHGDQVWLRLHRGAIYGSSWKYSTFSGFLLYQD